MHIIISSVTYFIFHVCLLRFIIESLKLKVQRSEGSNDVYRGGQKLLDKKERERNEKKYTV